MTEQPSMLENGWAQPTINDRKLRWAHWFKVIRNPGPPVVWIERRSLCKHWYHYHEVISTIDPAVQCPACRRLLKYEEGVS